MYIKNNTLEIITSYSPLPTSSSNLYSFTFLFNNPPTTKIYTLSLHDALPIYNLGNLLLLGKIGVFHNRRNASSRLLLLISKHLLWKTPIDRKSGSAGMPRPISYAVFCLKKKTKRERDENKARRCT